jgi:DNA-binding transcriptional LysR family regulator
MNLRQLEHVIAIAEEGGFARAAQRVHLSQPALTRSIQAIEEELGATLFDRSTRELRITPTGQTVVMRARRVLFEARSLVRDVDLLRNDDMGSVSFGVGPYPAALLIPAVLKDLAQSHPKLQLKVSMGNYEDLIGALRDETLDFLISEIRGTLPCSELDVIALPKQRAAWYVREEHPLAGKTDVRTRELHAYPIVSVPLPEAIHEGLSKWLRFAPNRKLKFHLVCNDVSVLEAFARQTDSLLLLASHCAGHSPTPGLVPVALSDRAPLWMQFGIVHLAGRTLAPAAQETIAAIQRAAGVTDQSTG